MNDNGKFPRSSGNRHEAFGRPPGAQANQPGSAADALANALERRKRRRALISAPVRVRSAHDGSNVPDEISTTVDVSRKGFLFLSPHAGFIPGMTVAVTFPYSVSALPLQAEQPGHVVRVSQLPDGCFAVGIALGAQPPAVKPGSAQRNAILGSHSSTKIQEVADRPLVVVVDADVRIRESLKSALSAEGYEVIPLHGPRQAHALLNQLLPALLIAEIEGEDLPGLDLCARIKSTPRLKAVPVVLTTRSAYPTDYANAHSLGAVVCIAKPFRMERLSHIVQLLVPTGARS